MESPAAVEGRGSKEGAGAALVNEGGGGDISSKVAEIWSDLDDIASLSAASGSWEGLFQPARSDGSTVVWQ